MATIEDLQKLDIRVGEIMDVTVFEKARKPAYQLWIDFGDEIGIKKSSAQIIDCYGKEELLHKQIIGAVNFPPRQIANFTSEVLVLGVYATQGVVLIEPNQSVQKGDKIG